MERPLAVQLSARRRLSTVTETWTAVPAGHVRPGDVVRIAGGTPMTVSRIEAAFFGNPAMLAFVEDTAARWFKRALPVDGDVEVRSR